MSILTLFTKGTTFVSSSLPTNNFSTSAVIAAGTDNVYDTSIAYLKFDLSAIPVKKVESAVLRLYIITNKDGISPSPLVINRVITRFRLKQVNFDTNPNFVPTKSSTVIAEDDFLRYKGIDITPLVNKWLNRTYPNYGIALTNSVGFTPVQFGGKPVGAEFEPRLVITYHTSRSPLKRMWNKITDLF